jgi:hypothetical protein
VGHHPEAAVRGGAGVQTTAECPGAVPQAHETEPRRSGWAVGGGAEGSQALLTLTVTSSAA